MAIFGKSSMAALLLLVAVLAGSCATGANANFNVSNLCNTTVSISPPGIVIPPGQTVSVLGNLSNINFLLGNKTFPFVLANLGNLLNVSADGKLEILCNGTAPCGTNALKINVYTALSILNIVKLTFVGFVCAFLKI